MLHPALPWMHHKDARPFLKNWIRAKRAERDAAHAVLKQQVQGHHGLELEHQLSRCRLYAEETERELYDFLKGEITP